MGDAGRAREEDDAGPLAARLPARRWDDLAVLAGRTPLRGASERRGDDRSEPSPGEGLAGRGRDPCIADRIRDALGEAAAQRDYDRIVRLADRDHELSSDLVRDADAEASRESRPLLVVQEDDGTFESVRPHELVEQWLERLARIAQGRRRAPLSAVEDVSHARSRAPLGALRRT